ncbi:MAG: hypothetical protein QM664_00175 [Flavihumibacter sp.]
MKQISLLGITIAALMAGSCNNAPKQEKQVETKPVFAKGSLGYDEQFLRRYDSDLVRLQSGDAAVLVSPKYQAKVFTSAAAGDDGASFGWINYKAFDAPVDQHMNAYGGENRFWLGPEGGKYSVFFRKGDSMVFAHWKTHPSIDTETWEKTGQSAASVELSKTIQLTNYTGAQLDMKVNRRISITDRATAEKELGVSIGDSIRLVGYQTWQTLTNTGKGAWNETSGMPCIWILDMFNPSPATTIIVPFKPGKKGKIATTDYFGEIAADRLTITDSALFFKADGKSRGKLGIVPERVLPFAGSYDAAANVLTIAHFTVDNKGRYLNQEWNTVKPVFSGDAMNAYNDGPLADGSQMGPFYEIESVSPAAALSPGQSIEHRHDVYHFTGSTEQLNAIAQKLLGVSLSAIPNHKP